MDLKRRKQSYQRDTTKGGMSKGTNKYGGDYREEQDSRNRIFHLNGSWVIWLLPSAIINSTQPSDEGGGPFPGFSY